MIIPIVKGKELYKFQQPFLISFTKTQLADKFLNMMKGVFKKAHLILTGTASIKRYHENLVSKIIILTIAAQIFRIS